ncbi:MAG: guanylate kinase [Candidatus Paracaedimonas acanthamoebae]|uniref:Guanylate kinase n=1 Tax=Candidatus Paracaedimonas acanthamoebae TaxID=244581 RepID=A0A8J7PL06_9PROT|nr:guanylate kinase [Candidatus Paracaedimonas acanthamoebae]
MKKRFIDIERRGLMLVLSSPSGAGKTSLARKLLETDLQLMLSISITTRKQRPGEIHSRDYFFVTPLEFAKLRDEGELLEHARVFDNDYGTPRAPVEKALSQGKDVLFDIDWQGTQALSQTARGDMVTIFILPPSCETLEERLKNRAQDSEEVVSARMAKAVDEMSHWAEYDYVIVNEDFEQSVADIQAILVAERLKRQRQIGLSTFVNNLRHVY